MKQNLLHITIDLGDTLFESKAPKITVGLDEVKALFPNAKEVLFKFQKQGHKISVISKIDHGMETRVGLSLFHHELVPQIISARNVHFCYERKAKGEIAKSIGSDIHIDDRVEALNSVIASGIKHNILFIGGHDDRDENGQLISKDVRVVRDWDEVLRIIETLNTM